jgi:hypothetical protein
VPALLTSSPASRLGQIRVALNSAAEKALLWLRSGYQSEMDLVFGRKYEITTDDLIKRSRRGIARRLIRYFPEKTWAGGFSLIEKDNRLALTRFERDCESFVTEHSLPDIFQRLDIACGTGRNNFAVLFLGIGREGEKIDHGQEIRRDAGNKLIFARVVHECNVTVVEWDKDETSPHWGKPLRYRIDTDQSYMQRASLGSPVDSITVHRSRIIHFCPNDELFSDPELVAVWNYLDDLENISGSFAQIFKTQARNILAVEIQEEALKGLTDKEKTDIVDAIEEQIIDAQSRGIRYVIEDGYKTRQINNQVNKMQSEVTIFIDLIFGTLGIAKRPFLGSEEGVLASDQDTQNLRDSISLRQKSVGTRLVKMFFDRIFEAQILIGPRTLYRVEFTTGNGLTLLQKVDAILKLAQANQAQGSDILNIDEIREEVMGWFDLLKDKKEKDGKKDQENGEVEDDEDDDEVAA